MEFVLYVLSPALVNCLAGRGRRFWPKLLSACGSTSDARLKLSGAALPQPINKIS